MKTSAVLAQELDASIVTAATVERIDREQRVVHYIANDFQESVSYADLILATGAEAIQLPLQSDAAEQVCSVNSLQYYRDFLADLPAPAADD